MEFQNMRNYYIRQSTYIMGADCISLIILRNVKLHPHDMPNLTNQIEMFTEN